MVIAINNSNVLYNTDQGQPQEQGGEDHLQLGAASEDEESQPRAFFIKDFDKDKTKVRDCICV